MELKKQFDLLIDKYKDNLEYLSEGLLIDVMEQIHEQMKNNKFSRTDLAQKLGCSNAYVTKLLNGNENLTLKKLVQIAQVLECSIDFAMIPKQYDIKRHITFNSKKLDTKGYTQPISLEDVYEQRDSAIAA